MTTASLLPESYRQLRQNCRYGLRSRNITLRAAAQVLETQENRLSHLLRDDETYQPLLLAALQVWLNGLPPGDNDDAASEPDYRRRRTICCPHLVMDGQPASYLTIADAGIQVTIGSDPNPVVTTWALRVWTCPAGRGSRPFDWTWAADVCTTTWQTGCAFRPAESPAPDLRPAAPSRRLSPRSTLARRLKLAIKARKLRLREVSLAMGEHQAWASGVLRAARPGGMHRIADWLIGQQRAA